MTLLEPTDPIETLPDPKLDPIGPNTVEIGPWRQRLTQFQRIAGGFMMFKGLTHWSGLLGIGDGSGSLFQQLPVKAQAATVFFAVIDLVAGVALWLGSAWGAMLWLLVAAAQVLTDAFVLERSGFNVILTIIEVLLVAGYVIIRFMAHVERSERR
jgi:hypothetical protein